MIVLRILAVVILVAALAGFVIAGERDRRRTMAPPPPPAPPTVARHRAGAVEEVWKDHTPLPAWERLRLAPTHNDPDVFVPQAQTEDLDRLGETRPLVAPKRPNREVTR